MLLAIAICMVVISILVYLTEIKIYKVLSKCLRIQQEGKSYVEIVTSEKTYGWIQNRDMVAIQNNMKTREEHIRIETGGEYNLVQVRSIREINKVKTVFRVIKGNLN